MMEEIVFLVTEVPEGGHTARAVGLSLFTEAATLDELRLQVRDCVQCHFSGDKTPERILLQWTDGKTVDA